MKSSLKAIVVDDNQFNLQLFQIMMKKLGCECRSEANATNGLEAIKAFDTQSVEGYDIVFTDIRMPDMNGNEFAHKIRALGYNMPIVAISGFPKEKLEGDENSFLYDDYLRKPFGMQDLEVFLKKWQEKLA